MRAVAGTVSERRSTSDSTTSNDEITECIWGGKVLEVQGRSRFKRESAGVYYFCWAYGFTLYTLITGGLLVKSAVTMTYAEK